MTPYQLGNRWLDLDTIQQIVEPRLEFHTSDSFIIAVYVKHAFTDAFVLIPNWFEDLKVDHDTEFKPLGLHPNAWLDYKTQKKEAFRQETFATFKRDMFEPFLRAWTNRT